MPTLTAIPETQLPIQRHLRLLPYTLPEGAGAEMVAWPLDLSFLNGPAARRALNVAVALIGLVVLAPLMLIIAAAVRLTSQGSVIFTQTRIGVCRRNPHLPSGNWRRGKDLGGKPFTMYKFRTMFEADDPRQVWATPDDPRVTPIGRILRKYRLDELPQLINVVRGEMNIVGPRPEQPELFDDLRSQVAGYHLRQRVLPGITGWSQVNQSYDTCLEDVRNKVRYDLDYIRRASALEDLKIMTRTMPIMIGKKGAW